jgi:hypothetical protein
VYIFARGILPLIWRIGTNPKAASTLAIFAPFQRKVFNHP